MHAFIGASQHDDSSYSSSPLMKTLHSRNMGHLMSHIFGMTTLLKWWRDELIILKDFQRLQAIRSSQHEESSSKEKTAWTWRGSSSLGPTPDPGKYGTHVPRTEDLGRRPTSRDSRRSTHVPKILEDDPWSQNFWRQPHVHPHEHPLPHFQKRSWGGGGGSPFNRERAPV